MTEFLNPIKKTEAVSYTQGKSELMQQSSSQCCDRKPAKISRNLLTQLSFSLGGSECNERSKTLQHLPGLISDLTVYIQNFTTDQSSQATDVNLVLKVKTSAPPFSC